MKERASLRGLFAGTMAGLLLTSCATAPQRPITPAMVEDLARQWLARVDLDGDGRVSRSEYVHRYERTPAALHHRLSAAFLARIAELNRRFFDEDDRDSDGYLSIEEILERPRRSFACIDADHDGVVTPKEVGRIELPAELGCDPADLGVRAPRIEGGGIV
jgi:EF hand